MRHYTINTNCNWILTDSGDAVGFSYNTPVVARIGGKVYRTSKKWSVTTSKHIGKLSYEITAGSNPEFISCDQSFLDSLKLSDYH